MKAKQLSTNDDRVFDEEDNTTVSSSSGCVHEFIMKGTRSCECIKCNFGLFVDSLDDFYLLKKIVEKHHGEAN